MTGKWWELHNEKLNDVFSSPKTVRMMKSKRNEMGGAYRSYGGKERSIEDFGMETWGKETIWKIQA